MPSLFPPIADFGFLVGLTHRRALFRLMVASDSPCVSRFDAPSVFGSLLDREAGTFRFGPFGINVPTQRVYEAGNERPHDHVEDAIGGGSSSGSCADHRPEQGGRPPPRTRDRGPTTTPSTPWSARWSASTARSRWSSSASRSSTTADIPASWTLPRPTRPSSADATGPGQTLRLHTDMSLGIEGSRVRARRARPGWRADVLLAVVGLTRSRSRRTSTTPTGASTQPSLFCRTCLDKALNPGSSVAVPYRALVAGDQGAHSHADRRDRRPAHHRGRSPSPRR